MTTSTSAASGTLTIIAATPGSPTQVTTDPHHYFVPATPEQYAYDADGNLLSDGHWVYTYDAWNRLVKVASGSSTVATYAYDGGNRRVTKTAGGTTRHYYFTDQWQVVEERLGSSTSADRRFVWGQRGVDDLVLRERPGLSERLYALDDPLNITAIINTSGTVEERYGYTGFGVPNYMNASFGSISGSSYDWETLFASYRYDTETGMYQVRNRYYHANLGIWTNRDPIEYKGGINLYAYCGNNGINAVDPMGLGFWSDVGSFALGATKAVAGLAVGVVAAAVVLAVAPAALAVGIAAAAALYGGYQIGKNAVAIATGVDPDTGKKLDDNEFWQREGEQAVNVATLGLASLKWMNRGASADMKFLQTSPGERLKIDQDLITTNQDTYKCVKDTVPGQRNLKIWQIDPSQYKNTWGSGASSALRFALPFGQAGAGVATDTNTGNRSGGQQ